MTPRECWLTAGLVTSGVLCGVGALWQQARYHDARDAVNRYVALDEREEKEDPTQAALVRQARPEIRTALANGEFDAALKRLRALEAEDAEATSPEKSGPGLPLDQLWPPNSPERRKVQEVLKELVRKQAQGYDLAPAQNKLVEVADAARSGNKDQALAAFAEAANQVRSATLRPGFKAPIDPAMARKSPATAAFARQDEEIRKLRAFRSQLPQMAAATSGRAEGPMLERLQSLLDEILAAHEQKRDLRAVLALTKPLGPAFQEAQKSGDWSTLERQFGAISAAIKKAPAFPKEAVKAAQPPASETPPAPGAAPPTPPGGVPPRPDPKSPGMPSPGAGSAENLLKALDTIRALPEAEYQARRPMIAMFLAQAAGMGRPGGAGGGGRRSRGRWIPVGNDLQLLLTPEGGIAGLSLLGEPLSAGMRPGGATLHLEGKGVVPLQAPLTEQKESRFLKVEGPEGALSLLFSPAEDGVSLRMIARRTGEGPAGSLRLSLPIRLGGWRWSAAPTETADALVLAVDAEQRVQAAGGKLPKIVVRGAASALQFEGPTAAEAGYDGKAGHLWVRLPLPAGQPVIEHTVHLKAVKHP